MPASDLTPTDLEQLAARGISPEEAARQLELFAGPLPGTRLARACVAGDGIEVLSLELQEQLLARGESAALAGRVLKFVPASGAASRMFQGLMEAVDSGGPALEELAAGLDRFPFRADLDTALRARGRSLDESVERGELDLVARSLLEPSGLAYASLPKGLLQFHRYPEGSRTAFEEHLVEAVSYARDESGLSKLHFTVSGEHRSLFEGLLESLREPLMARYQTRFEVSFSEQSPATDTLAADLDNHPFRLDDGELLLRPGGHGALIRNLGELGADLVVIKNIDNVVTDAAKPLLSRWKRILTGYLVSLEERAFELGERLARPSPSPAVIEEAIAFLSSDLNAPGTAGLRGAEPEAQRRALLDRLDRPLRVCGMVRNEGEPGGGPFWVDGRDGVSPQIVEQSQVDVADPAQAAILGAGTHFNPVDLVCGLRDRQGRAYDLDRFIDQDAVFIATKSKDGRPLKALERPGLWNGAMAHWNTLFVEVPSETFAPVKTVFDLLRPAHQPATE